MTAFLAGFFTMLLASLPAYLMARGGKNADFKDRLKLWAIGMGVRFFILGAALFLLFTQTSIERVPCVIGAALAYFLAFAAENFASKKTN